MRIGHQLAEHNGLESAVKPLDKGVFVTRLVVGVDKSAVHLGVAVWHYRKSVLDERHLGYLLIDLLRKYERGIVKLLGRHLRLLDAEFSVKRSSPVSRGKA